MKDAKKGREMFSLIVLVCSCLLCLNAPPTCASSTNMNIDSNSVSSTTKHDNLNDFTKLTRKCSRINEWKIQKERLRVRKGNPASTFNLRASNPLSKAMKNAFECSYLDPNGVVQEFLDRVELCRSRWCASEPTPEVLQIYSPYFTVVQSSMIGKTRLFFHVPHVSDEYVIYICLRDPSSSDYPPSDPSLYHALTQPRKSLQHFLSFLFASVLTLLNFLKEGLNRNVEWIDCQKKDSHFIWKSVKGTFHETLQEWENSNSTEDSIDMKFLNLFLNPILANIKILFVFDEAGSLNQEIFSMLLRALRFFPHMSNVPVAVFTERFFKISSLPPKRKADPSYRYSSSYELFPPFYLIANVDLFLSQKAETLNDMSHWKYYMRYGRPLWGALIPKLIDRSLNIQDVQALARSKLLAGLQKKSYSSTDALAILGVRLSYDIAPQCKLSMLLVAQHMRSLFFVSDDCEILFSGYFSEPVLVQAAAQLTYHLKGHYWAHLLKTLLVTMQIGLIVSGYRGVMTAKILLLFAWDKCCLSKAPNNSEYLQSGVFLEAIELTVFLGTLLNLSPEQFDYLSSDFGAGGSFGVAWIRCTHFIKINYLPTKNELFESFQRGVALLTKDLQLGVDLIIPCLFCKDKETTIDEDHVSCILVQVKNRATLQDYPLDSTSLLTQESTGVFVNPSLPYLSLYLSLGPHTSNEGNYVQIPRMAKYDTRSKSKLVGVQKCIAAFSLSPRAFKILEGENQLLQLLEQVRNSVFDPLRWHANSKKRKFTKAFLPLGYAKKIVEKKV